MHWDTVESLEVEEAANSLFSLLNSLKLVKEGTGEKREKSKKGIGEKGEKAESSVHSQAINLGKRGVYTATLSKIPLCGINSEWGLF